MGRGQRWQRVPCPHPMGMGEGMHGRMPGADLPGSMMYSPRVPPNVEHIMPPNMMPNPMQNLPPMGVMMEHPKDNFVGQPMYNPQFPPHLHPAPISNHIPLPSDFEFESKIEKAAKVIY